MKVIIKSDAEYGFMSQLQDIWEYRELLQSWAMREIAIRYKQAAIGVVWVVLQPLLTAAIYTIVFSFLAKIPSDGVPYPVFVLSGLILWQFFSRSVTDGANSLVTNADIITKVYFPRHILPLSIPLAATVDALIAYVILLIISLIYGYVPGVEILIVPPILGATALLSFSLSLWLSPLNAIYRDVGLALPFFVHVSMFLTPVIYPVSMAPEEYQWLFYLNPMATLIELSRWAFIGTPFPQTIGLIFLGIFLTFSTIGGLRAFKKLEPTLIDRI